MAWFRSAPGRKTDSRADRIKRCLPYLHKLALRLDSLSRRIGRYALRAAGFYFGILKGCAEAAFSKVSQKIGHILRKIDEFQRSPAGRGELSIAGGLFCLSRGIAKAARQIIRAFASGGPARGISATAHITASSFKGLWAANRAVCNYLAPLAGVAVLAFTIYTASQFTLALSVSYGGKSLGLVQNEKVFKAAVDNVEQSVQEASGEYFTLSKTPVYSLKLAKKTDIVNEDALYDNILNASGSEVVSEYGLYVDSMLVGSNSNSGAIQAMIDGILIPYKNDPQVIEASFVQDISIKAGLFPKNASKSIGVMKAIVTGDTKAGQAGAAQKINVARSVSGAVYEKHGLVENGLTQGRPVSLEVKNLKISVKVVKSEVSTQSIPYQVVEKQSGNYYKGYKKTTVKGQNGLMQITSQVSYVDGKVVDSQVISTTLLKAPVNEQVLVGTRDHVSSLSAYVPLSSVPATGHAADIIDTASRYIGIRYRWGGASPATGFDCSGFTHYVFAKNGIYIARNAAAQSQYGSYVSKSNLIPGDLVFFDTNGGHNGINHVGIYIGNGMFIDASSGRYRVTIDNLNSAYWRNTYMTARRLLK